MKAWTSAAVSGRCAYDSQHTWKAGERIFRVQGVTWAKNYCQNCARSRQEAPSDTGQLLDLESAPTYPAPLREIAEGVREPSALFAERFEDEHKVLPFDGRMAAAGRDED